MSPVDFSKCQRHNYCLFHFVMPMWHVKFKKLPLKACHFSLFKCRMVMVIIMIFQFRMSNLRKCHVALSIVRVKGHIDRCQP